MAGVDPLCRLGIWNNSGGSVCWILAKIALRLVNFSFVVCGQREAGGKDSTETQSAVWYSKVTSCSWLVISSPVVWCNKFLQELLLLGPTHTGRSTFGEKVVLPTIQCCFLFLFKMPVCQCGYGLDALIIIHQFIPKSDWGFGFRVVRMILSFFDGAIFLIPVAGRSDSVVYFSLGCRFLPKNLEGTLLRFYCLD